MERGKKRLKMEKRWIFLFVLIVILLTLLASSLNPQWNTDANYTAFEDTLYVHNLTHNITGWDGDVEFEILDTDLNKIYWFKNDTTLEVSKEQISDWIFINDPLQGDLFLNASYNNQSGLFNFTIQAKNESGGPGSLEFFIFILKAVNDPPKFFNLNNTYSFTKGEEVFEYINATDEEEHYPLSFDIEFLDCSLAPWSNRTDCDLFNLTSLTNISNTSTLINFTPDDNDVGTYFANISVRDSGINYPCIHSKSECCEVNYQQNKTSYILFNFTVESSFNINVSDCQDKILNENEEFNCLISVITRQSEENVTFFSNASLRNYFGPILNGSWFFSESNLTSENNFLLINITLTPGKTEIGNWSIIFKGKDSSDIWDNKTINLFVNRTNSSTPTLENIPDVDISINLSNEIEVVAYDNDFLIPDKEDAYNETLTFNLRVFNFSNLSEEFYNGEQINFNVTGEGTPVIEGGILTNKTNAKIGIFSESGNGEYLFNLSVEDKENKFSWATFKVNILDNSEPVWNISKNYTISHVVNSTEETTDYIQFNLVNEGWVWSEEGHNLNFTFEEEMTYFNMTSEGVINFKPYKEDVGLFEVLITADSLGLQSSKTFTFNITNLNSVPTLSSLPQVYDEPFPSINVTENSTLSFYVFIFDDDLIINSEFYNETFNFTWKIINKTSETEVELFDFEGPFENEFSPDKPGIEYFVNFIPNLTHVGNYTVTLNVTDKLGDSDEKSFNLSISKLDNPPQLSALSNQSSAVGRAFYYRINATHFRDGSSTDPGNQNFTFSYNFLEGTDFLTDFLPNSFNEKTGEIDFIFEENHAGVYHLNITVQVDSTTQSDWEDFWIFVYDYPNISFPIELPSEDFYSLKENEPFPLNLNATHSVGDNLTYEFYMDRITHNLSEPTFFTYSPFIFNSDVIGYGNGTNFTFNLTPNFYDETYGFLKNLTLVVYPSNPNLINSNLINATRTWKVNVSHSNAPMTFLDDNLIGDKERYYTDTIVIDLTEHFEDIDAFDTYYNQTANFEVNSNLSNESKISYSLEGWILTLSASSELTELLNITGMDLDGLGNPETNATSNNFLVKFIKAPTSPNTGGTTTTVQRTETASLSFNLPSLFFVNTGDTLNIEGEIINDGGVSLTGISLNYSVLFNKTLTDGFEINASPLQINSLSPSIKKNLSIDVFIETNHSGIYELIVNAKVNSPSISEKDKIILVVGQINDIDKRLLFVEEFIVTEHPECIEALETVRFAEELINQGKIEEASKILDNVVIWCRESIEQSSEAAFLKPRFNFKEDFWWGFFISFFSLGFFLGILYIFYRKIKLKRLLKN
ncbi:hypothetical protein K0A97_02975 [Patescibacteria group bacterium]|nr:hypothetical protein [Patescibacteria group bacterium]